jgi:diguanylate cyclase (GGDEF)-like protein/PAS domain S-box-containing protein
MMSDYFHTLKKIVAKHFQEADISSAPLSDFLQAINQSFEKYDFDLRTLEQSLTLSAEELVMANEEMHAVFQAIPDQLIHLDEDGHIIAYKSGLSSHHYLTTEKIINKSIDEVVEKKVAETFDVAIKSVIKNRQTIHFEFMVIHQESDFFYEVRIMLVKNQQVIALIRDITDRKNAEEQIAYLAYHDSLTGLPNTRLFKDRLIQSIASAKRNNRLLAVLFLDLDRFKIINDTMGHGVGDKLLQETSSRLLECVRDSDSVGLNAVNDFGSSVARMGGDEFTIMLEGVDSIQAVSLVAQRLIDKVSEPVNLDGLDVYTSTSIGVALYPNDGDCVESLLGNADAAMYHAKDQGKNNFQFYTESMNEASAERLEMENSLHKALTNNEFVLYYQPQVDVVSGKVIGMEALIRWQHPENGFISPAIFIPLAEDTGLVVEIGTWVIREACQQLASWIRAGFKPVKISVNLSAKQLQVPGLDLLISETLKEMNVPVEYLSVELTETAIIVEPEIALKRLNKIKSLGIQLSLDDFGTGYSSLSYLRRFPIDTLKIDQVFIRDIKVDHEAAALVKAIISMAHSLGMNVVAEGVETQDQLEFLAANACDMIQGYLFSKPAPAEELNHMLVKM